VNLIYTVAYDPPGWRGSRTMAKLLCSSLLRGFWGGEIMVFRNFVQPLFPVERKGLEEIHIDVPEIGEGPEAGKKCLEAALKARFQAVEWIEDPARYEWIVYLDADCLALRDVEHLFAGNADVLVQPERGRSLLDTPAFNGYVRDPREPADDGAAVDAHATRTSSRLSAEVHRSSTNSWLGRDGINAGTFAVRGAKYAELMREWKRLFEEPPLLHGDFRDQTTFNRLLLETDMKVRPFERREIMFPLHLDERFLDYRNAALLHFLGGSPKEKIEMAFGLHMIRTYGNESGLFLDMIDS
jgi:hypothetical protein